MSYVITVLVTALVFGVAGFVTGFLVARNNSKTIKRVEVALK